ncbi:hypothetical protein DFP72DRAFT_1080026 [Ephemerocybe angulata]|uniref:Uncharacterized protein n=1 Tax=Ephemerocybe angulata TaxID=980116 RepID=A0A8H6HC41_9AGAR|nr:hypothetical protein DFP72DRAFT_1080026 [Tulosesus angulatus]
MAPAHETNDPPSSLQTQTQQQHAALTSSASHPARLSPSQDFAAHPQQQPQQTTSSNVNNANNGNAAGNITTTASPPPARLGSSHKNSPLNPSGSLSSHSHTHTSSHTPTYPHAQGHATATSPQLQPRTSGASTPNGGTFSRMADAELRALGSSGSRASMAAHPSSYTPSASALGGTGAPGMEEGYFGVGTSGLTLPRPPALGGGHGGTGSNRGSMYSVSGDSIASLAMGAGETKYPPSLFSATPRPSTPGSPLPGHPGLLGYHHSGYGGMGGSNGGGSTNSTGVGLRQPALGYDPVRGSMFSDNRTSIAFSLNYGGSASGRGVVAYAYDPMEEDESEDEEDDWLHDPEVEYPRSTLGLFGGGGGKNVPPPPPRTKKGGGGGSVSASSSGGHSGSTAAGDLKGKLAATPTTHRTGASASETLSSTSPLTPSPHHPHPHHTPLAYGEKRPPLKMRQPHPAFVPKGWKGTARWSWRGAVNIATLVAMFAALLCLFMVYPVVMINQDKGVNSRITGNARINATGQAVEGDGVGVDVGNGGGNGNGGGGGDGGGAAGTDGAGTTSTSRTVSDLNPGGVTFNRRGIAVATPIAPVPSVSSRILRFAIPSSSSSSNSNSAKASASASPKPEPQPIPASWFLRPTATATVTATLEGSDNQRATSEAKTATRTWALSGTGSATGVVLDKPTYVPVVPTEGVEDVWEGGWEEEEEQGVLEVVCGEVS